jgi:hypothetical protein
MATHKPAGNGKRIGAARKPAKSKTKIEGEEHRRRQGAEAERRRPDRKAAIDAWVELTSLVLVCGFAETGQGDWLRSPAREFRDTILNRPAA